MRELPTSMKVYRRTAIVDEGSVPSGLLKDHQVADDVWAKIVVLEGHLTYVIQEPVREVLELTSNCAGIIEPKVFHHVIPHEGVRFYVEFYR